MFLVLRQKGKAPAAGCVETLVSLQLSAQTLVVGCGGIQNMYLNLYILIKTVLSRICAQVPCLFTSV